jgi:hypothetical protein
VRSILPALQCALLLLAIAPACFPQAQGQTWGTPRPKEQFFTGTVMSVDDTSLTVNRTVLGKNSATRTFILSAETKFEGGKPKIRSQVTVRYVSTEDGDTALNVIVRRSPK